MSPRARQAKSKARISAYEKMSAERFEEKPDEFEIQIPPGKHLGDLVVEAEEARQRLWRPRADRNLDFRLPAGGIVGVIGPNGAGKTTLFRMMIGQEQPDGGELRVGPTVELGYVDQNRDALAADKTVYEEISGGNDKLEMGGQEDQRAGLRHPLQLPRPRPGEEGRHALRRRTQPRASGQAAAPRLATCCCSTNRRTISTSIRCGLSKKRS